jgi:hypothetical protein
MTKKDIETEAKEHLDKIEHKRQLNIAIRAERERRIREEHPTLTKWQPVIQFFGVLVVMVIFFIALAIIFKVQSEIHFPST